MYFILHADNEFFETPFIVESDNILNAHIKFQESLEKIDAALDRMFPCRDSKTTIKNIHESPFAEFSEDWLKVYIETIEHDIAMEYDGDDEED